MTMAFAFHASAIMKELSPVPIAINKQANVSAVIIPLVDDAMSVELVSSIFLVVKSVHAIRLAFTTTIPPCAISLMLAKSVLANRMLRGNSVINVAIASGI